MTAVWHFRRLLTGRNVTPGLMSMMPCGSVASIHCGSTSLAGQKWRMRHGKSRSGTEYGPLTDLPDWSYADGRPAPPSKGQKKRTQRQRTINERIWHLIKEMDDAKGTNVNNTNISPTNSHQTQPTQPNSVLETLQ